MMKKLLLLGLLSLNNLSQAHTPIYLNPWSIEASLGMGVYSKEATINNNQTALARLSLGHGLYQEEQWQLGLEAGIQNNTTLQLNLPKEFVTALGGVAIHAELKPTMDLLLNFNTIPLSDIPTFVWAKGGIAYRQLHSNRMEVNNIHTFAPEMQLGLGYKINESVSITAGYQRIWGKNTQLTINALNETGTLHFIPMQQAVLVGFSYRFL